LPFIFKEEIQESNAGLIVNNISLFVKSRRGSHILYPPVSVVNFNEIQTRTNPIVKKSYRKVEGENLTSYSQDRSCLGSFSWLLTTYIVRIVRTVQCDYMHSSAESIVGIISLIGKRYYYYTLREKLRDFDEYAQ
jgi:hypothetical protein